MTGEYAKILEILSTNGSSNLINNSSPDHAAIMIQNIFKIAAGPLYVVTDHLKPFVYNRIAVVAAASKFLGDTNNSLEVILQMQDKDACQPMNNPFIAALAVYRDRIKLYDGESTALTLTNHFMVAKTIHDGVAMRFELDIKNHVATGSFNAGKELGDTLMDVFKNYAALLNPFPLPALRNDSAISAARQAS